MAPEKTVDIGSFSITSKFDKNFALTVSNSMTLSLPDHFADHLPVNELRDQVRAGALWLTRARSCRLTLAIHFEQPPEMTVQEVAQRRQLVIEAFQSLPVWHDLGLELRLELDALRSNRTPSATSIYYIQHAQQHSGLFVPKGVPCGYFSELSCSFRYAATSSTAPEKAGESMPRSRSNTYYNFRKLTRTPPAEPGPVNIVAFWDLSYEVQAERVVYLTQNALNLMLGMRRRCLGIRFLKGTKPPALLEIAPAVWNARHFQNVVSRSQLIPAISSALGSLMSTQSPGLLQKIESLVPESAAGLELVDKVLDELHRQTQVLLLRSAGDQKIKTCLPRAKTQSAHPPNLVLPQKSLSVPNAFTRNDFTDYASLDLVKESLHLLEDRQSHGAMTGIADHVLMHLELESSRGFTYRREGSAESNGVNLEPELHYMHNDMEGAGRIDNDVVSFASERLLNYDDLYNENGVGEEILDLTYGERGYHEQHLAPGAALQEHDMENTGLYDENDNYGHYHEMSDVEGRLRPTAHAFEDSPAESNLAAGTLDNSGHDCSDFFADEDDVIGIEIHDHHEEGIDTGDYQYDACKPNGAYDQVAMLDGVVIDDAPGPNYIAGGHVHHDNQAEVVGGNTRVGSRRARQDWSQVFRDYAYHGTEERARRGRRPIAFTRSWSGYQELGRGALRTSAPVAQ